MITALFESYLRDMTVADLIDEQQHLYAAQPYASSLDMEVIKIKLSAIRHELFRRLFSSPKKQKYGKTTSRHNRISEGIVFA